MAAAARPVSPAAALVSPGGPTTKIQITVNDQLYSAQVEPRTLLVYFLRETLGLTGTHVGCDTADCGGCTVLLEGKPVKSCTIFVVQANGRQVRTVEGLAVGGKLSPVQEAFIEEHGLQCGFCTSGMMMTAAALLERRPDPSETEIRDALRGNLCRCTGYASIVAAVRAAGKKIQASAPGGGGSP